MRKYFEDLSFTEGVLLFSAFAFAIFIRFFDLGVQSPWTDELASWFYLRNLDQVFYYESHSPLYYFLLRLIPLEVPSVSDIRAFSGVVSLAFLGGIYFLGRRFLDKSKVIALIILLSLSPSDIVYARMARHYSMLFEGSLFFYFLIKGNVRTWITSVFAFLFGFIHVFGLIPVFVILVFDYLDKKDLKRNFLIMLSSSGIIFYYLARFLAFGSKRVGENVAWNNSDFSYFAKSTITQFLGDAYPRLNYFETNFYLGCSITGIMFLFAAYRRKKSFFLFIGIAVCSVLLIEIVNLGWLNLRINRYVIYLSAFLIFAFIDAFHAFSIKGLIALYAVAVAVIMPQDLLSSYPWDNEVVTEWKEITALNPDVKKFICVNKFQAAYYNLAAPELCSNEVNSVDLTKPLLFLDLNNNSSLVTMFLMQEMNPLLYKNFKQSRIIHFEPR